MKKTLIAMALLSSLSSAVVSANTETDELRKIIEQQQKILKNLEQRLEATEHQIEATADQIESTTVQTKENPTSKVSHGHGKNPQNTRIGGYGELHYNNYDNAGSEIDFHRFVLFFGHEFSDSVRFFSEFELEHAISGEGQKGEVEIEQAFIEIDLSETLTSSVGLFLVPVGIINETHEPPTFYGVERNTVEKNIVPATWWEAGAAINYKPSGGVSFDMAITSGLQVDTTGGKAYNIRSGRNKVAEASAENLAFTSRIKYTAIPGLQLSATVQYQSDITQGFNGVDVADATLIEAHAIYQLNKFSVRALYARWDINGNEARLLGRDEQVGWYVEPSYKFNEKLGTFARYSTYDNEAGNTIDTAINATSVGLNYYVHEDVVLKADYEMLSGAKDSNGFNLGVGYQF